MREELVQSSHGDDAQASGETESENDGVDVFEETTDEDTGPLPGDNIDIDPIIVEVAAEEVVDLDPSGPLGSAVSQGNEGQDGSDVALDDADVEIADREAKSHAESTAPMIVDELNEIMLDTVTEQPEAKTIVPLVDDANATVPAVQSTMDDSTTAFQAVDVDQTLPAPANGNTSDETVVIVEAATAPAEIAD
jgi:hypothetical protein